MYLEKLEIQGFKSFAHPTTLVFNRDLTVIVGPNGSGKSNVADAVRWVLGEQSVKTLRGKKSEDVIFAGSDKKNKLGFAQASLYLNNKDKQADVDYEQIIITRKVERNGDSEYLINNNKVRLLDVQLLLAKANFGQRTYSVIGQGMIDSILVSSAQERKEFFDEATGVKQFQIKKNQSVNKLSNAKNNLEQTGKILAELEPRLRSLTRQVKKLEKRESLAKELTDLQTNYYSFLRGNLDKSLGEKRTSFQIAQKKVADLNQQLIELQTKLEKEETTSSRQDNFEILQDKLGQHQNELNTLLKEKTILEGRSDLKLMSSGQSDVVWLKQRIDNLRNDINKNSLLSKEKKSKLNNSQDEVNILEAKREQVLAAFSKLEERLLSNGHDLSPEEMASKVNNILNQQKDFQTTLNTLISLDDLPKLKEICYSITESMSSLAKKIKVNKEEDKKHWKEEFNKMLSSKDNLVAEISEARTSLAILENELQQLGTQVAKDTEELNKLDSDKKALLDKSGGNEENKKQLDTLVKQIEFKNKEVEDIEKQIKEFNESEDGKKRSLVEAQRTFREVQANFNSKNSQLNEVKVDLARLETREEELNREISEEIPSLQVISVKEFNPAEAKDKIYKLKGIPEGGYFNGLGVVSNTGLYNPAKAGDGADEITYHYILEGDTFSISKTINLKPIDNIKIVGNQQVCTNHQQLKYYVDGVSLYEVDYNWRLWQNGKELNINDGIFTVSDDGSFIRVNWVEGISSGKISVDLLIDHGIDFNIKDSILVDVNNSFIGALAKSLANFIFPN